MLYEIQTRRERYPSEDVIAYMIRQSFKPGEVTPAQANKIGYALALEFTKGQLQFIVATHTDKAHIHNHLAPDEGVEQSSEKNCPVR